MAVQDCEITLRWVEFDGERLYYDTDEGSRRSENFFATIHGDSALFGTWYGEGEFPISDPEASDSDIQHEIPLAVFQRAQRSMAEPDWSSYELPGCGSFRKEGDDRVRYTTECGQEYEFDLDDIIELFGP